MENKTFFLILTIVLFCASTILYYFVKKKFYKKSFSSLKGWVIDNQETHSWDVINDWVEERFQLALFFPKVYFQKKAFWKGYLLYLLSILLLVLGFVAFYIYLNN
jgi:hypothetical protein